MMEAAIEINIAEISGDKHISNISKIIEKYPGITKYPRKGIIIANTIPTIYCLRRSSKNYRINSGFHENRKKVNKWN